MPSALIRSPSSVALGCCLAIVLAIIFLVVSPVTPRFSYAPLNYAAVIGLTLALPGTLLCLSWTLGATVGRWLSGVLGWILILPAILFALLSCYACYSGVSDGVDDSIKPIAELRRGTANYVLYEQYGIDSTEFSVLLRREYILFSGIKLVSNLWSVTAAQSDKFEQLPSGLVRVTAVYLRSGKSVVYQFQP